MRLNRSMLWGGLLGAAIGVAAAVISLFQVDSSQASRGQVFLIGLVLGVPVTSVAGVVVGWVWGLIFPPGPGNPVPGPQESGSKVGQYEPDAGRRKRRQKG